MRARKMAATAGMLALLIATSGCAQENPAGPAPAGTGVETPPEEPSEAASPAATPEASPETEPSADETEPPQPPADGPAFVDPGAVAEAEPGGEWQLGVTGIRTAANDGFDRVVFDLEGEGTPGWRVEYVKEALDDGSGLPVGVDGNAVLQVRIAGTGMPFETGIEEFSGGPVSLSGTAVQQVVYRFTFEGYSTAFVGVDDQRPFRVFMLEDPLRVVVDVQH